MTKPRYMMGTMGNDALKGLELTFLRANRRPWLAVLPAERPESE